MNYAVAGRQASAAITSGWLIAIIFSPSTKIQPQNAFSQL